MEMTKQEKNAARQRRYRERYRARVAGRPMPDNCEACGQGRGDKPLSMDHDHSHCSTWLACSDCFRGWVCQGCNLALGHANDDPNRLIQLAAYLIQRQG